ncbi:sigma-70 family RNA polymerase sigma factor [Chitinophaga oryzae]|uniref:Sigma-70 family RNA polymerase sigma factor n=1 Tax=Chitinophaga oryzae TaxID=2725414 RepID=A0AAE6ZL68_9BACT|nr:sigma-70 family RNA polymerase sigma factor [Chitinophaga oryzae]QJB35274.1 sigma-70 family RNA polymerase sigma factor [Chitinophaga oryzae]QJB41809.1 sigma-70 family RNA polymerase sigma factor [Chitinophaga oryzae]
MEDWSDKALVSALQQDREDAFRILYDRHWDLLYSRAFKKIQATADISDILQEIFAYLWKNRQTLVLKSTLVNYLLTALDYKIIDYYRARAVRINYYQQYLEAPDEPHHPVTDTVQFRELESLIQQEVQAMPSKMQEVFLLSRDKGMSAAQIASQLAISEQTVRNQISNALARLRNKLANTYLFPGSEK